MKYEIKPTEDLYTLNKFFEENDLEIGDEDEPEKTDPVAAWNVVDTKGMAGGILLALCEGEYILDGIAVREDLRGTNLGKELLFKILKEAKNRGAKRIYLVARAPDFFRKYGFKKTNPAKVPPFFGCLGCPQYNKICFPEVMIKEGLKNEDYN